MFSIILIRIYAIATSVITSSTVVNDGQTNATPPRRVRRRLERQPPVHFLDASVVGDDTWLYTDLCLDTLVKKYEFRVKALIVEKRRRQLLAEKIVLEAVNVYCTQTISTTLYDSDDDN